MLTQLCTGFPADPLTARTRLLAWLGGGAGDVTWAVCNVPRERWVEPPPHRLGAWPALRHVRHLALRASRQTVPTLRHMLGELEAEALPRRTDLQHVDAAWDPSEAVASADEFVRTLGQARFELLQRVEAAPDAAWQVDRIDRLLLDEYQHELEHLSALWKLALYWDRSSVPSAGALGLPLQPADRLEESH